MNEKNKNALLITVKKMVPAVLIAMIATALGLLSLYRSKVPMINDFGSMLTIGIVSAFMIAVLIFLPFLYIRDQHFPKEEKLTKQKDKSNKVIYKMIGFVIKMKYVILSVAVILAVIGIYVDQSAEAETNLENFMPQDSQGLADIKELRDIIGSTEQIAIVLSDDSILTIDNLDAIINIENSLNSSFDDEIIEMTSLIKLYNQMGITNTAQMNQTTLANIPVDQRKLFINDDYTKTTAYYSTGKNEKGWSFSGMLGHWQGDGYVNYTQGQGQTYFFSVGYQPDDKKRCKRVSFEKCHFRRIGHRDLTSS